MPELIAKTALDGQAPLTRLDTTLAEGAPFDKVTALAVFPGQERAINRVLKPLGISFPAPNTFVQKGDVEILWTGRGQAFLVGAPVPEGVSEFALAADQTDGWARLTLSGPLTEAVLSRLVAVDLRLAACPVGRSLRSGLNHMPAILIRREAEVFDILVFRSMARTAWHELAEVLDVLAARAATA